MRLLRFKETYSPNFPESIPEDIDSFLKKNPFLKRFIKYFKRHLIIFLTGQISLETNHIPKDAKHILWINLSSPSLGDTLMDLAGRSLLEEYRITLLTDSFTLQLYQSDRYFEYATDTPSEILNRDFDHVLIDSYSTKGLQKKLKIARKASFSGMYGFFDGPDINKTLFSYFRLNQLLERPNTKEQIIKQASTHLYFREHDSKAIDKLNIPHPFITIAIGGEWKYRTYHNWEAVIDQLPSSLNIILVGSGNGADHAKNIISTSENSLLLNYVNELSLLETATLISRSLVLLCSDGGLMHVAHSVNTPTITLFSSVPPQFRTTQSNKTKSLYDDHDVSNINPTKIVSTTIALLEELGY